MGLVNVVLSTAGKGLDAACFLLDLNFIVVHTVVQTLLAVISFINSLPTLFLTSVLELGNFLAFCLVSAAEATTNAAQGTVAVLGRLVLALEGLQESLKMVGYLSMHVLLRGKDHMCRALLSMLEACGIAVSLVVYFINTVVNYAAVGVWQMVSSLQKVLELALTSLTFLYSSLVGMSAFLCAPCKLVLDFLVSLVHMFISIFILNIYGLLLTVTIALTTTAYLNPQLIRQAAVQILNSFPALHRLYFALRRLALAARGRPHLRRVNVRRLRRILHHLYLLETRIWQQLSRRSGQIGLALRTQLHGDNNNRARGDGNPDEERRGPPDGRAGDGAHQEMRDLVFPSSSTDRPLKKVSSPGRGSRPASGDDLLTLLKEQEERKKCVICQDCTKTVVLLPCRHLCLCRDCTNILLRLPSYQQNCPLCRHMILNTMDVYL